LMKVNAASAAITKSGRSFHQIQKRKRKTREKLNTQ
jgi:hypothetical protein